MTIFARNCFALLVTGLVVVGCGGSGSDADKPTVKTVKLGETATVTGTQDDYKISMTLTAQEGKPGDLKDFRLSESEEKMTPWYVTMVTKNLGEEVGKDTVVVNLVTPKDDHGLDAKKIGLIGDFPSCELVNLPQPFPAGKEVRSCQVYLVPEGSTLEKLVYHETRFEGADREVVWKVS